MVDHGICHTSCTVMSTGDTFSPRIIQNRNHLSQGLSLSQAQPTEDFIARGQSQSIFLFLISPLTNSFKNILSSKKVRQCTRSDYFKKIKREKQVRKAPPIHHLQVPKTELHCSRCCWPVCIHPFAHTTETGRHTVTDSHTCTHRDRQTGEQTDKHMDR